MIGRNVSIFGRGAKADAIVLDAAGSEQSPRRVLHITNGSHVQIAGLTITGGWTPKGSNPRWAPAGSDPRGGAIALFGGALTLSECRLVHNRAFAGGAIFSTGALHVHNSYLAHNLAAFLGGAILAAAASRLESTLFESNVAAGGGAVTLAPTSNTVVSGCTFLRNNATNRAGALDNFGQAQIASSRFLDNRAEILGGALENSHLGAALTMHSCEVRGNRAQFGGGLLNSAATSLVACDITDNQATQGGAVFNEGGAFSATARNLWQSTQEGYMILIACTLARNSASGVTVRSTTDSNHSFSFAGGTLYNSGTIDFTSGTTLSVDATHNHSDLVGQAIYNGGRIGCAHGRARTTLPWSLPHVSLPPCPERALSTPGARPHLSPIRRPTPQRPSISAFDAPPHALFASAMPFSHSPCVASRCADHLPAPTGFYVKDPFICRAEWCENPVSRSVVPCPEQRCDYTRYEGTWMALLPQGGIETDVPTRCADGFYATRTGCIRCPPHTRVLLTNTTSICQCEPGFFLRSGECVAIPSLLAGAATFLIFDGWGVLGWASLLSIPAWLFQRRIRMRARHPVLLQLRDALRQVDQEDMRLLWMGSRTGGGAPSEFPRTRALRITAALIGLTSVAALPWLPTALILIWVAPLAMADPQREPAPLALCRQPLRLLDRRARGLTCVVAPLYVFWLSSYAFAMPLEGPIFEYTSHDYTYVWSFFVIEILRGGSGLVYDTQRQLYGLSPTSDGVELFTALLVLQLIQAGLLLIACSLMLVLLAQLNCARYLFHGSVWRRLRWVPLAAKLAAASYFVSLSALPITSTTLRRAAGPHRLSLSHSVLAAAALLAAPALATAAAVWALGRAGLLDAVQELHPHDAAGDGAAGEEDADARSLASADAHALAHAHPTGTGGGTAAGDEGGGGAMGGGDDGGGVYMDFLVKVAAPSKYVGDLGELVLGRPRQAAMGLFDFIQVEEQSVHERIRQHGLLAVVMEWTDAKRAGLATEADLENLEYVRVAEAGSSDTTFHNGWARDRAVDGARLRARQTAAGEGMRLVDFAQHPTARSARLSVAHVLALRLYTTSCFTSINRPLRALKRDAEERTLQPPELATPHPLPCTLFLIYDGLKRLRAAVVGRTHPLANGRRTKASVRMGTGRRWPLPEQVRDVREVELTDGRSCDGHSASASPTCPASSIGVPSPVLGGGSTLEAASHSPLKVSSAPTLPSLTPGDAHNCGRLRVRSDLQMEASLPVLWRGMRGMTIPASFHLQGGSELAPCSTTADLRVAVRYACGASAARAGNGLLFRVLVPSFMQQGADLSFLSAFPHEREALYPPLTFFRPKSQVRKLTYDDVELAVMDVEPHFPS